MKNYESRCKCGAITSHKTGQCFECRNNIKKCAFPCCDEKFQTSGDQKYCKKHRYISDKEAYLAGKNSLNGYREIRNAGITETGFSLAMMAFVLVVWTGLIVFENQHMIRILVRSLK